MEKNILFQMPHLDKSNDDCEEIDSFKVEMIDEKKEPKAIQFLEYWKGSLNFGYCFLIIPFRLKQSTSTGKLEIHCNRLQQVNIHFLFFEISRQG
jgi:hypothetical protein